VRVSDSRWQSFLPPISLLSTNPDVTGDYKLTRKFIALAAIAALGITAPATFAVAQGSASSQSKSTSAAPAGPTVSSNTVGIRRTNVASATAAAPAAEARLGAGRNVALMVVGGAALIIGAVIGGTAGVLIAVTGAAVGLYGLYHFVQ
jgi:hypothetical protein